MHVIHKRKGTAAAADSRQNDLFSSVVLTSPLTLKAQNTNMVWIPNHHRLMVSAHFSDASGEEGNHTAFSSTCSTLF